MSDGANPRRLTNTSDCSRRASRAAMDRRSVSPIPSSERAATIARQNDWRQHSARIRAVRKLEAPVALLARVQPRFERRGRAAEHDGNGPPPGAPDGGIAGVVAHVVLLLVRRILFLVDDDESQRRQRREHGQARPQHQLRQARRGGQPLGAAFAAPEATVQRRDAHAGRCATCAGEELRRQVDLGNQHQDLAPLREHSRRGRQINVGLAAAGHAVQQKRRKCPVGRCDGIDGGGLRVVQRVRRVRRVERGLIRCDDEALAAPDPQRALGVRWQLRDRRRGKRSAALLKLVEQRARRGCAHELAGQCRGTVHGQAHRARRRAPNPFRSRERRHCKRQRESQRLLVIRRDEGRRDRRHRPAATIHRQRR